MFSRKRQLHVCEDCDHEFVFEKSFIARRVFLSYGHDEHASLAERLKNDLSARGHLIWFDKDRLYAGHDWEAHIEKGLEWLAADKANSAMVLLLTPHSVRRPEGYCLNEITRALGRGLRIIPLMVVDSEPPLSICRIQWLDMRECIPINEKEVFYLPKFARLLSALEENQLNFEGTQQWLLKHLQPLEFDAEILQHIAKFAGRQWVFDAIQSWLADNPPKQRVFWITGSPGFGKTAISAVLSSRYLEVSALHLCKFGHEQKSDSRRVVTSIAYQLTTQLPDYEAKLAAMDLERLVIDDSRTMFDNLLVQPLSKLSQPNRPIVILIDALDEATSSNGHNALSSFIAAEFPKTPLWLRLIITSRPERAVTAPMQGLNQFILDAETEANRADIREYLQRELAPSLQNCPNANGIVEQILNRSEGVFLYVERVCHDIHQGNLSLDRLEQFPRGLGGVFWQFFERQFPDFEKFLKEVCPVLRAILAASEPLPLEILQRLFLWQDEELRHFTRTLGSLFPVTKEGGVEVIKPYHKALADWLADEATAGPYFVSISAGQRDLANYGLRESKENPTQLSSYFLRHLPAHLIDANRANDFSALILETEFSSLVRESGGIVELLEFCTGVLALPHLFTPDQNQQISAWIQATPEDKIGQSIHEKFISERVGEGRIWGENPWMCPWQDLRRDFKVTNWRSAAFMIRHLRNLGYGIRIAKLDPSSLVKFSYVEIEKLAKDEHTEWCISKRAAGWTYGPIRDDKRRLHPCLVEWWELPEENKEYDRQSARNYPQILSNAGFEIYRIPLGPSAFPER